MFRTAGLTAIHDQEVLLLLVIHMPNPSEKQSGDRVLSIHRSHRISFIPSHSGRPVGQRTSSPITAIRVRSFAVPLFDIFGYVARQVWLIWLKGIAMRNFLIEVTNTSFERKIRWFGDDITHPRPALAIRVAQTASYHTGHAERI
jgi:hypothetical protein